MLKDIKDTRDIKEFKEIEDFKDFKEQKETLVEQLLNINLIHLYPIRILDQVY